MGIFDRVAHTLEDLGGLDHPPKVVKQTATKDDYTVTYGENANFRRRGTNRSYVIFNQYSDVIAARAATQFDGYGRYLVDYMVTAVLGVRGIAVQWEDERMQELWDNWKWNIARPWERPVDIQRDVLQTLIRDGESVMQIAARREGLFFNTIDSLSLPTNQPRSILYDDMGRPTQYNFRSPSQPVIQHLVGSVMEPFSLPAQQVIHMYREDFPNQRRGVTWLRSAIEPLSDLTTLDILFQDALEISISNPGAWVLDQGYSNSARGSILPLRIPTSFTTRIKKMLTTAVTADARKRSILPYGTDMATGQYPSDRAGSLPDGP